MSYRYNVGETVGGRYVVVSQIGQGGMGHVLGVQPLSPKTGKPDTSATFALKYCASAAEEDLRRFAREVRFMQKVNHKNVMPVVDANLAHDPPFFVMPLATHSLAEETPQLSQNISAALDAFTQMCEGVSAIHLAEGTHRDIKPLNAMRMPDGRVVVSDLGLVKFNVRDSTVLTKTMIGLGTVAYCAPEQLAPAGSREADARTDVFQLGKTLYELLTGEVPALMDLDKPPAGLTHVIRRATRDQPAQRYGTVGQLRDAVEAWVQSQGPGANPTKVLEAEIQEANTLIAGNKYRQANLENIARTIIALKGHPREFLQWFDRIPPTLFGTLPQAIPADTEQMLEVYVACIKQAADAFPWSWAEDVADRMKRVVATTGASPEIHRLAIEATLIAAVKLHRFAAMDAFNAMLKGVSRDDVAAAVAEMLEENLEEYTVVAASVQELDLHPSLIPVRRRAEKK